MMSEPMSEERLEELRRDVVSQVASAGGSTRHSDAYTEMLDEIDRLRAEVERLREVLRDIAYNTSTSIPFAAPPETYIVGQLHSCIGRSARALNPEPSA